MRECKENLIYFYLLKVVSVKVVKMFIYFIIFFFFFQNHMFQKHNTYTCEQKNGIHLITPVASMS